MTNPVNYQDLCRYARDFARLDSEKIKLLHHLHPIILPRIPALTAAFYAHLLAVPKTAAFLEGRVEQLQQMHARWMEEMFTSEYDETYTQRMFYVGEVHVKVKLPVEFMPGAMAIMQAELLREFGTLYAGDPQLLAINDAINSAISFSLLVMQESFQSSSLAQELENFLEITGMSRKLFNNLALAYGR